MSTNAIDTARLPTVRGCGDLPVAVFDAQGNSIARDNCSVPSFAGIPPNGA